MDKNTAQPRQMPSYRSCFDVYTRMFAHPDINDYLAKLDSLYFSDGVIRPLFNQACLRGVLPDRQYYGLGGNIFRFWEITLSSRYAPFCCTIGITVDYCRLSTEEAHQLYTAVRDDA